MPVAGARIKASDFGSWINYTPAWTSTGTAPALGNGSLLGRYYLLGQLCYFQLYFGVGSTTTFGTGTYSWSLPFAVSSALNQVASGLAYDSSATNGYACTAALNSGSSTFNVYGPPSAPFTSAVPFTWANPDQMRISGVYETT